MDQKIALIAVIALVVAGVGAFVLMSPAEELTGDTTPIRASINGVDYTWEEMLANMETKTVNGDLGVSLSALINDSSLANPDTLQYQLIAEDGYFKNVTWGNMMNGILFQTEVDGNMTLITSFPTLSTRYMVKFLADITPITTDLITVNGREYTWDQPFDRMFDEANVSGNIGIRLSDLINHTDLANPDTHDFKLIASDGYNKTVDWTAMLNGVLIKDEHKCAFADLATSFHVKDLVAIEIV